jgi:hypothetical protein
MKIVRRIVYFLIGGAVLAGIFSFAGMPWNKIVVLVPWLAILTIVILAIIECTDKARWFKNVEDIESFQKVIWDRGTPDEADAAFKASADRAVAYVDRLIDRQINKARGILPFNSLIMAVFSFERTQMPVHLPNGTHLWDSLVLYWLPTSAFVAILLVLGVSSWLCLDLFLVFWRMDQYATYRDEVYGTIQLFFTRSISVQLATILSEASLFIGLCLVIMIEGSKVAG